MDSEHLALTVHSAKWCVDNKVSSYGPLRHVYLQITEGRDSYGGFKYSWCGDFVTWALMQGGVRDGAALNRAALNNGQWQMGANISRLALWAKEHGSLFHPKQGYEPEAGDPVIIQWPNGDHIGIYSNALSAGAYESYDGNTFAGLCAKRVRTYSQTKAFICARSLPVGTNATSISLVDKTTIAAQELGIGIQPTTASGIVIPWPTNDSRSVAMAAQGGNGTELPAQR